MRTALLVAGTLFAGCSRPDAFASSNFSYDAEDWGVEGVDQGAPTLEKSYGNPPASICAGDDDDAAWRFQAPPKYFGDASSYYGRVLTWDAQTTDTRAPLVVGVDGGTPEPLPDGGTVLTVPVDAVWLTTTGLRIATRPDFDGEAGITWTPMSVTLDTSSHWHIDGPNPMPATQEDIERVLRNVISVEIRGGWSANREQGCIDNIYFGTK